MILRLTHMPARKKGEDPGMRLEQLLTPNAALEIANSLWDDELWQEGDLYARLARTMQRAGGKACWDTVQRGDPLLLSEDEYAQWLHMRREKRVQRLFCIY